MTRQSLQIDPKDIAEVDVITFEYVNMLGVGETIQSVVLTAEVFAGIDASPSGLLLGSAQISGTKVLQEVQAGVAGVEYLIRSVISTSINGRKLTLACLLPVVKL